MSTYGFNMTQEQAMALDQQLFDTWCQDFNELQDTVKSSIIIPLSECWFTKKGVEFSNSVNEMVNSAISKMHEYYMNFKEKINTAADNWASTTGNEASHIFIKELDANGYSNWASDIMKETNSAGAAVIEYEAAMAVANKIPQIEQEYLGKIESIHNSLDANTQFIGGEQAEALKQLYVEVTKEIQSLFSDILVEVKTKITEAAEEQKAQAEATFR